MIKRIRVLKKVTIVSEKELLLEVGDVKDTKDYPQDYEDLVDLICEKSGLSREEIERRIEAKRAKLSGLISKEGAAQIIASELGIDF